MTHADYVSPRTLRRRKGRAIRKARREYREFRQRFARVIVLSTGALAAAAAAVGAVASSACIAMTRLRALEEASAKFAEDVIAQSECPDAALHPLMEWHHCGYQREALSRYQCGGHVEFTADGRALNVSPMDHQVRSRRDVGDA